MTNREIDLKKVEKANHLLKQIMELIQEYDRTAKELNPAELLLTGSLVAAVNSEYSVQNLVATIGHPAHLFFMLDSLTQWMQRSVRVNQPQQPNLSPATGGKIN